jgi:hypothetical protein
LKLTVPTISEGDYKALAKSDLIRALGYNAAAALGTSLTMRPVDLIKSQIVKAEGDREIPADRRSADTAIVYILLGSRMTISPRGFKPLRSIFILKSSPRRKAEFHGRETHLG